MDFTEEQILQLAPDEPSKKAGKDLANPSKWVSKGVNDIVMWGECQGSGSKPYQTSIDLTNIAFKCSCPSRKFPCKHGLGLFLLHARQPASFSTTEMPTWVSEWISRRTGKEEKKEAKESKPVDETLQAKRQESRHKKVSDGIEEALLWIKDIVRNGIVGIPEKSASFWEGMAKRMIDAQAPGLANSIKNLRDINFFKEGWQSEFLDGLLNMYLLMKAYQSLQSLLPLLQEDVKSRIGFTYNQDELKEQNGVNDVWLVLAKQVSEEDGLTTERFWLYGINSGQTALLLQFIVRGQGGSISLTPGMYIQAELVFFPSILPLRALIKKQVGAKPQTVTHFFTGWKMIVENETDCNAQLPFISAKPYLIKEVTPLQFEQQWWLKDADNNWVKISNAFNNIWKLMAVSGGKPVTLSVMGKENVFLPLGIWINDTYKPL